MSVETLLGTGGTGTPDPGEGGAATPPAGGAPATPPTGGEGGATPPANPFLDTLPEALRSEAAFKDMQDVGALAQAHHELLGKQPVVPDTAEGYTTPAMPDGLTPNKAELSAFKAVAKEQGLTQAQFDAVVAADNARAERFAVARKAYLEKGTEELKKDWGADYESNKALAHKTLTSFAGEGADKSPALVDFLSTPFGIKFLHNIGKQMSPAAFQAATGMSGAPSAGGQRAADGSPRFSYPSMNKGA